MKKVVIFYFFLSLITFFIPGYAKVTLNVKSSDGLPLKQVGVGHPFAIEVVIEQEKNGLSRPNIKGLEQFIVRNSGYQMYMVNGVTTTTYSYTVRIDKKGNFKLGPAEFTDGADMIISNVISVLVGDKEITEGGLRNRRTKKGKSEDIFFRLSVAKDRVVVGEKITGTLRLYYDNGPPNVQQIIQPDDNQMQGLSIFFDKQSQSGKEDLKGKTYNFEEWKWTGYIDRPGSIVVPAFGMDYIQPAKRNHRNIFFATFFEQDEIKRIYSNGLTIKVDSLPSFKGEVDAVGEFTYFNAHLDPAVAKEGEGMVFTLALTGDVEPKNIKTPVLKNIPYSLRSYDSKRRVESEKDGFSTIFFEYIVQGFKKGEWEIPEQEFNFFDTKTRSYKTLKTSPVMLKIVPNHNGVKPKTAKPDKKIDNNHTLTLEKLPLNKTGPWYPVSQRELPFMWFIIATLLISLVGFLFGVKNILEKYIDKYTARSKRRNAFSNALKQIKAAQKNNKPQNLYIIFVDLFSHRLKQPSSAITQERIIQIMYNVGFTKEEIKQWHKFWNLISTFAFSQALSTKSDQNLFAQAGTWIGKFKGRV